MTSKRACEQLHQERETFEQLRHQLARWFALRLCMGYAGLALMACIAGVASFVLLHPQDYSAVETGGVATATALLIDLLSLAASIFGLVLSPGSALALAPVTQEPQTGDHSPIVDAQSPKQPRAALGGRHEQFSLPAEASGHAITAAPPTL